VNFRGEHLLSIDQYSRFDLRLIVSRDRTQRRVLRPRAIGGAIGAKFLSALRQRIEQPEHLVSGTGELMGGCWKRSREH